LANRLAEKFWRMISILTVREKGGLFYLYLSAQEPGQIIDPRASKVQICVYT
jgi:hypothetical protein